MALPDFNDGLLPEGVHEAVWDEVVAALAFSRKRQWLLEGLRLALIALGSAGCERVYIDGSFVTDKEEPGDFDICWEMASVDISALDPVMSELRHPRASQRAKYRGDILPNVVERGSGVPFLDFFQVEKETGKQKGIIAIDPRGVK